MNEKLFLSTREHDIVTEFLDAWRDIHNDYFSQDFLDIMTEEQLFYMILEIIRNDVETLRQKTDELREHDPEGLLNNFFGRFVDLDGILQKIVNRRTGFKHP